MTVSFQRAVHEKYVLFRHSIGQMTMDLLQDVHRLVDQSRSDLGVNLTIRLGCIDPFLGPPQIPIHLHQGTNSRNDFRSDSEVRLLGHGPILWERTTHMGLQIVVEDIGSIWNNKVCLALPGEECGSCTVPKG